MQLGGPIILGPFEKAMTPAEAGISMYVGCLGRFSDGQGVKHALEIREPLPFVPKVGQGRFSEGVECPVAGPAAIALEPMGVAMAIQGATSAMWARHRFGPCRLDQRLS